MAALEAEGFITQPHTSAGRIPTEKAYRYYIVNVLPEAKPQTVRMNITLRVSRHEPLWEERLKQLGEALAESSGDAVMMATTRPWSTTLGISNLLRKPDFRSDEAIERLATSLEQFDGALKQLLHGAHDDVRVIIGEDNPFGSNLGSVVIRHRLPDGAHGIMSIIGPMRMDYGRNIALLNQAKQMIEQPLLV
jgi:heat-inducible transcriptional repressor